MATLKERFLKWKETRSTLQKAGDIFFWLLLILLKGSEFKDISRDFFSLGIYAVLILTLAVTNYRKTT